MKKGHYDKKNEAYVAIAYRRAWLKRLGESLKNDGKAAIDMENVSLLIAMRRASKKVKTQRCEMGAKNLFAKILEVKKRIHRNKNNNDSGNLDSEGSEAEPTRADLEAIVNDFVVKGNKMIR